jgi:hypothetical protein
MNPVLFQASAHDTPLLLNLKLLSSIKSENASKDHVKDFGMGITQKVLTEIPNYSDGVALIRNAQRRVGHINQVVETCQKIISHTFKLDSIKYSPRVSSAPKSSRQNAALFIVAPKISISCTDGRHFNFYLDRNCCSINRCDYCVSFSHGRE